MMRNFLGGFPLESLICLCPLASLAGFHEAAGIFYGRENPILPASSGVNERPERVIISVLGSLVSSRFFSS